MCHIIDCVSQIIFLELRLLLLLLPALPFAPFLHTVRCPMSNVSDTDFEVSTFELRWLNMSVSTLR